MLDDVRIVRGLNQVDTWPVDLVAVGVTTNEESVGSHGNTSEAFDLASVTKLLTAYAVLVAVEEGTLNLDDPLGPEGSTVRHLLAHAGGIGPGGELLGPPGVRRVYSNAGYDLLGDELADRAEMPFADYLNEAVLSPLAMKRTRLEGSPAFGGVGTVEDLLAFGRELLEPRLVSSETLIAATTVNFAGLSGVLPGYGRMEANDWGQGFELRSDKTPHWTGARNSPRTFGHFGASGTFLWVDPDAQVCCVCLTDRPFGDWAHERWPVLSDAVIQSA